jgi:hypothetical protein
MYNVRAKNMSAAELIQEINKSRPRADARRDGNRVKAGRRAQSKVKVGNEGSSQRADTPKL